jgi:iron complex outermembrane receptor protein
LAATIARAADDNKPAANADANPIFELGTVTVYGSQPEASDLMPVQIDAGTIDLLEKPDVAQALATLPGVTLTRIGARNEETVFVRGFSRVETPIYIDGVPAYVPYDGYVDLGRFMTYDVADISVAKGYSSVLYGPNTMGGAINIVSRQPQSAFEGQFGAGVFSGDGYETSLNLGTKQNLWFAQFGASYVNQDTFPLSSNFAPVKAQAGGDRNNAYHTDWKVSGKIAYTPNATDEYAVGFVHQDGNKGDPPYTGALPGYLRYWQWPQWNKQTVYYLSNTRIGDSSYIKPRIYYDWYDNALDQYTDGTYSKLLAGAFGPSMYHDHSYGTSVEAGTDLLPGNTLKGAVYYKFDHHDEQVVGQPHYIDEDRTDSVALEDTWRLAPAWELQTGASYDLRKALRADQVNPDNTPVALTTFNDFNPEAGLFYKLAKLGAFHSTIAHKSRFTTIKERYSYKYNTAFPNPGLNTENATHYELGYDGEIASGLTLHTSAYYSRIHDAIESVNNVNGTTRSQNQNVGTVDNAGLDLGLDYAFGNWFKLGGSYTYLHQKNITYPAIKATDTPVHSGTVYAEIQTLSWLSIVPSETFSSWRYAYTNGQEIGGYSTTDLKFVVRLGARLSIDAGVGNLFDKNYELEDGYPEAGRNWFANMHCEF